MALTDTAIRNAKPAEKPYKLTHGKGFICWSMPQVNIGDLTIALLASERLSR